MKKIKFFSILALLVSVFGLSGNAIHAEETATETQTDLDVQITDSEGPVNPVDPWKPTDPDKPGVVDPEVDDSSRPNGQIGTAKLGIWRIPGKMKFSGKMDYAKDYSLDLDGKVKTRVISVADVRAEKDTNWQLSGQLSELESVKGDKIQSGYKLKFGQVSAKKHKVEGNKIYAKQFEDGNSNGVIAPSVLELDNVAKEVAKAENGQGKGYTGIVFDDISLDFDAGVGSVDSYTGQVLWTLSDTIK